MFRFSFLLMLKIFIVELVWKFPRLKSGSRILKVEADVQAGTRALPTLVNVSRDFIEVVLFFS